MTANGVVHLLTKDSFELQLQHLRPDTPDPVMATGPSEEYVPPREGPYAPAEEYEAPVGGGRDYEEPSAEEYEDYYPYVDYSYATGDYGDATSYGGGTAQTPSVANTG